MCNDPYQTRRQAGIPRLPRGRGVGGFTPLPTPWSASSSLKPTVKSNHRLQSSILELNHLLFSRAPFDRCAGGVLLHSVPVHETSAPGCPFSKTLFRRTRHVERPAGYRGVRTGTHGTKRTRKEQTCCIAVLPIARSAASSKYVIPLTLL